MRPSNGVLKSEFLFDEEKSLIDYYTQIENLIEKNKSKNKNFEFFFEKKLPCEHKLFFIDLKNKGNFFIGKSLFFFFLVFFPFIEFYKIYCGCTTMHPQQQQQEEEKRKKINKMISITTS